ncbi:MAG: tRNA guanosine(34) transglycosylase Tgt [Planctomycetaceae bacterium]|jgi:queuine tRNA-ribosyltransferase|nr:tRNA guanosine(34) transglycosylase Tgt [Planctomycetaceae bacterium]
MYTLIHQDSHCGARYGRLTTAHGNVELPAFMPVGTLGTVKGVEISQLQHTGTEMILGNTYHLSLRPGENVVKDLGGLHQFCGWQKPILTDSGGFQIFSLAEMRQITEEGAVFRSHIDGRKIELTPEQCVKIQESLGSDIAMVLDHVTGLPGDRKTLEEAMLRSVRWAKRCKEAADHPYQKLFAIIQGGLEPDLRRQCAEMLAEFDFSGYAVGGLSVGETPQEMYDALDFTLPYMPESKPRYLMGVGKPEDILHGILRGVDLFDCVIPTRNGRNAQAFTHSGTLRLRNAKYLRDDRPLDETCPCPACKRSRGYLRHLFIADEMLGPILLTIHNLTYYQRLVTGARNAIKQDRFVEYFRQYQEKPGPQEDRDETGND